MKALLLETLQSALPGGGRARPGAFGLIPGQLGGEDGLLDKLGGKVGSEPADTNCCTTLEGLLRAKSDQNRSATEARFFWPFN